MQTDPHPKIFSLWLALGIVFFGAMVAVKDINTDALSNDELRSIIVTGGAHHGPLAYPQEVIQRVLDQSPDQALGFPLIARPWGDLVGWSEFALRWLPMCLGLLTIAMVYRVGADLFNYRIGLAAAFLLVGSAFFALFMHKFRVYTASTLATVVVIWAYQRLVFHPTQADWRASLAFVGGGIGLFYSHYFAPPIAIGIGLYHLFFAPRVRWWRPVLLACVVALCFVPAIPGLLTGIQFNLEKDFLQQQQELTPTQIVGVLAHYFSNGSPMFFWIILIVAIWQLRHTPRTHPIWLLFFVFVGGLLTMIGINAMTEIFIATRVRYLLVLWIPLVLIFAYTIVSTTTFRQWLPAALIVSYMVLGGQNIRTGNLIADLGGDDGPVRDWRTPLQTVQQRFAPGDMLLMIGDNSSQYGHYTHGLVAARTSRLMKMQSPNCHN
ncbi:MAG: glycosyltransferase family 39 protein [Chloroflexota bacterium]